MTHAPPCPGYARIASHNCAGAQCPHRSIPDGTEWLTAKEGLDDAPDWADSGMNARSDTFWEFMRTGMFGQAAPDPAPEPDTTAAVCADLQDSAVLGLRKYGVALGSAGLSERALLQHAYEEALDLASYLKTLLERDK